MSEPAGSTQIPLPDSEFAPLLAAARAALPGAYAPYSKFRVAAAVLDERGRISVGVNVENASFGLTICAERNAIGAAVAAGARHIQRVLVISDRGLPLAPCGACRQVIQEFATPQTQVATCTDDGRLVSWAADSLLPAAFTGSDFAPDA
jgi:cytidine deaminase